MTIQQAILKTLAKANTAMNSNDILESILANNYYTFGAISPIKAVSPELTKLHNNHKVSRIQRGNRYFYILRRGNEDEPFEHQKCIFCHLPYDKVVVDSNAFASAIPDGYPVTKHHTLIIPKRHVANFFDLNRTELDAVHELIQRQRTRILQLDSKVTGFNIGVNIGKDAGQSIMHVHIHLIPRREGDMKNPKGGVRGVIPEKQKY